MPDLLDRWTRSDVLALPDDGNRYELVDGALLVTPGPRPIHQYAVWRFRDALHSYVEGARIGLVGLAPCDLDLQQNQLVQPDLFVVAHPPGRRPREWEAFGIPLLVVEVLSPSTARYDRVVKRDLYLRAGVAVYWVVDCDARLVERWTPRRAHPEIVTGELAWHPDGADAPLRLDLPTMFREIHGDAQD